MAAKGNAGDIANSELNATAFRRKGMYSQLGGRRGFVRKGGRYRACLGFDLVAGGDSFAGPCGTVAESPLGS